MVEDFQFVLITANMLLMLSGMGLDSWLIRHTCKYQIYKILSMDKNDCSSSSHMTTSGILLLVLSMLNSFQKNLILITLSASHFSPKIVLVFFGA